MTNLVKNYCLPLLAAAFCACNSADVENVGDLGLEAPEGNVAVRISVPGWNSAATRAGADMLYPINVLVFPDYDEDVAKVITIGEGQDFSISLPNGSYDLFAVCGLPGSLMPRKSSGTIAVPDGTDFAAGQASVTVKDGSCTPSAVNITAARKMAWLDLQVTGVPDNIATLNIYMANLCEEYFLESGWKTPGSEAKTYKRIPVSKNGNTYEGSLVTYPGPGSSGVTFIAEATTAGGTTTLLASTSSEPLAEGVHLAHTLAYSDLMVVEGGVSLDDWNDVSDSGTLSEQYGLALGEQYFNHPATVISFVEETKTMHILSHKPLAVTLDEVRTWDLKNIPYTLAPEIGVQRWAFPSSVNTPSKILSAISNIGLDEFNLRLASCGSAPIDASSDNVLAYYSGGVFYRYDFAQGKPVRVTDTTGQFLVFPLGIVQLAE